MWMRLPQKLGGELTRRSKIAFSGSDSTSIPTGAIALLSSTWSCPEDPHRSCISRHSFRRTVTYNIINKVKDE